MLAYKKNLPDALERLRLFYARKATDQILAAFSLPSPALAKFKQTHQQAECSYPDPAERLRFWDEYLKERVDLEDDSVPSAYLSEFDQGLYGGVLGGNVKFNCDPETGWISSMVAPLLQNWNDVNALRFDPCHPWMKKYDDQLRLFAAGSFGKFGISNFILINGLNFAFELMGATETYSALIDDSEMLKQAMTLGYEINVFIQKLFFERIPLLFGGTCAYGIQWAPDGRIIAESVDPFHMTSVDTFETWGRPILEKTIAEFDGATTHIHGNGRHLIEAVCSTCGLRGLFLGDDSGFPLCIDIIGSLRERSGNMPLVVGVRHETFAAMLAKHELPGGVMYLVDGAQSVSEANRIMEKVKNYRA